MFNKEFFRQYRDLQPGEFFLCFLDTAGEGQDWNAAQFLSFHRLDVPLVLHYEGSLTDVTPMMKDSLELIQKITHVNPCVAYETNNGGIYELERLARLNKYQKYTMYRQYVRDTSGNLVRSEKLGYNTNTATRPVMLGELQDLVKNMLVNLYDKLTVDEMFSFVKHKTPSGWRAEAEHPAHDDLLMALAGVWQMYQTERPPDEVKHRGQRLVRKRARFHVK